MTMKRMFHLLLICAALFLAGGCGGGGEGEEPTGSRTLRLTLSLTGALAGEAESLELMLELPAGVEIPRDQEGLVPPSNFTVAAAGAGLSAARYLPPAQSAPAYLHLVLVSALPLGEGPFATLVLSAPAAAAPGDFRVSSVSAADGLGVPLTGLGVTVAAGAGKSVAEAAP